MLRTMVLASAASRHGHLSEPHRSRAEGMLCSACAGAWGGPGGSPVTIGSMIDQVGRSPLRQLPKEPIAKSKGEQLHVIQIAVYFVVVANRACGLQLLRIART